MAELHQLIAELGQTLGSVMEPPAVYQRCIDAVVYHATTSETPIEPQATPSAADPASSKVAPAKPKPTDVREYAEAEGVIAQHCEREGQTTTTCGTTALLNSAQPSRSCVAACLLTFLLMCSRKYAESALANGPTTMPCANILRINNSPRIDGCIPSKHEHVV